MKGIEYKIKNFQNKDDLWHGYPVKVMFNLVNMEKVLISIA